MSRLQSAPLWLEEEWAVSIKKKAEHWRTELRQVEVRRVTQVSTALEYLKQTADRESWDCVHSGRC